MPDEMKVTVYCKGCDGYITIRVSKKALLENGNVDGGLISGTFLHKAAPNETHALLIYFDKNFNHRGTVYSKVIRAKITH